MGAHVIDRLGDRLSGPAARAGGGFRQRPGGGVVEYQPAGQRPRQVVDIEAGAVGSVDQRQPHSVHQRVDRRVRRQQLRRNLDVRGVAARHLGRHRLDQVAADVDVQRRQRSHQPDAEVDAAGNQVQPADWHDVAHRRRSVGSVDGHRPVEVHDDQLVAHRGKLVFVGCFLLRRSIQQPPAQRVAGVRIVCSGRLKMPCVSPIRNGSSVCIVSSLRRSAFPARPAAFTAPRGVSLVQLPQVRQRSLGRHQYTSSPAPARCRRGSTPAPRCRRSAPLTCPAGDPARWRRH